VSSGYRKSIKLLDCVFFPVFWLSIELHEAKKVIPSIMINILDFIDIPFGSANAKLSGKLRLAKIGERSEQKANCFLSLFNFL
jgi:hypothetical protein